MLFSCFKMRQKFGFTSIDHTTVYLTVQVFMIDVNQKVKNWLYSHKIVTKKPINKESINKKGSL